MNCIIIEDEVPAQEILQSYINNIPGMQIKGIFNSPLKANTILKEEMIDVIFLDINLPMLSGIAYLKTLTNPPKVIMTTAYSEYAAESFEYNSIIDYLIKPFSFERFLKAINKLEIQENKNTEMVFDNSVNINMNSDYIFINVDKTLYKVNLKDIIYVQSDRNYITVVTKNLKLSFIDTLKRWEGYLTQETFIQIHKSFIVNILFIDKVTGNLVFIEKEKIPVGRLYRKKLFSLIKPIN